MMEISHHHKVIHLVRIIEVASFVLFLYSVVAFVYSMMIPHYQIEMD